MPNVIKTGPDAVTDKENLKVLLYGSTGTGKTYALKTMPASWRPALILDCDSGSRALWNESELGDIVTFDSADKNSKPILYTQVCDYLSKVHGTEHGYKTLVMDSFTLLHQAIQSHVISEAVVDFKAKRSTSNEPPTLPEYGIITHLAMKFVQALIQMNLNLIVICHEAIVITDEASGLSRAGPALTPKLATVLPRYFDEVLYSKVKGKGDNRVYSWLTQSTGMYEARTRSGVKPEIPQDFSIYEQ